MTSPACQDFDTADALRSQLRSVGVELFDKEKQWRVLSDGRHGHYTEGGATLPYGGQLAGGMGVEGAQNYGVGGGGGYGGMGAPGMPSATHAALYSGLPGGVGASAGYEGAWHHPQGMVNAPPTGLGHGLNPTGLGTGFM